MTEGDPREATPIPNPIRPEGLMGAADLDNKKFVREFHSNTSSDLILITEDKALICLMQNFDRLRERDAWKVPAGILATLLTVMVTAAPSEKFGLSKETWVALGWLSTLLTGAWLIRDLVRLFWSQPVDPRSIVSQLKTITAAGPDGGR